MASGHVVAAVLSGLCLGACSLPTPDYKVIKYPEPYRKEADGAVLDNESIRLDAEGYRVDKQGRRIDIVDVQAKTSGESSNAVAGYYISSQGSVAAGNVMAPSEGATSGAGYGLGSATTTGMPIQSPGSAAGQPVPLIPGGQR